MQIPDNPQPSNDGSKNVILALIFISLAVLIGAMAFLYEGKAPMPEAPNTAALKEKKRVELEKAVNRHIQDTNRKIEIDKEKIKQQAAFTIPQVGQMLMNSEGRPIDPIDMRGDRNELNAARDLRRNLLDSNSADNVIHSEMADKEARRRQNEEYMREYARQFVENARRNGYEVELSPDYKVLNVRQVSPGSDMGQGVGPAFR